MPTYTDLILVLAMFLAAAALLWLLVAYGHYLSPHLSRLRSRFFIAARLWLWLACFAALALVVVVQLIAPQQVPVIIYKGALVLLGGLGGYILDRVLFRYAEPSSYLYVDWRKCPEADKEGSADYPVSDGYHYLFAFAQARQAAIIIAAMLAAGLGL